ncbi:hypothetical protein D3C86_1970120 [compost metagenome]
MPTGSIQTQHIASSASPNTSTPPVAMALAARAAFGGRCSVSSPTAKSSRRRVMTEAPTKVSQTTA